MNNANNQKTNKKLTYISTFNGIGVFSNALRQMNIEANPLYICEIDEAANNLQKKIDSSIVIYENAKGILSHDKTISNYLEVGTTKPIAKRTRKPKATKIINDNINVIKKIVNNPDIKYLNLTQARIDEYQQHLKNGGTITVTIEKYKTVKDKMNKKLESKKIITVDSMKQLGLRDAKNGIYRCKIIGSTDTLDKKIGKLNVLIIRPGGKSKYAQQMHEAL